MWEELGFYEGFSLMWKDVYSQQGRNDEYASYFFLSNPLTFLSPISRSANHIRHLLGLISQFPRINPSASDISSELDIPKLFRQIRSRYKALCSTLGVRPTLQYSERSQDRDERNESGLVIGDSRTETQSVQNSDVQRPKNSQSLDF
jgi:primary-amine oxidase